MRIEYTDRESWLASRKFTIGASEVATICGANPYQSPYALWASKTGKVPEFEGSIASRVGIALEGLVTALYEEEAGCTLHDPGDWTVWSHRDHPWFRCTPDRLLLDADGGIRAVVELKTIGERVAQQLKDGEPPLAYQVQLQAQMEILDCDYGELACLIGNREFLRFPFERNPKFVRAMMGRVLDFHDCIQNDEPPEVDATYSTAQTLAALHPDDNGETVTLEPLHVCWVTELERLKADIKKLEEAQALMQNRLREAIGDNTFACADGVAVTLKTQERKGYLKIDSDKRALVEAAGVPFAETKPSKFRVMRVKKEFGK